MLDFLRLSNDDYTSTDLVGKVAELAEKYPSKCDSAQCKTYIYANLDFFCLNCNRSLFIHCNL